MRWATHEKINSTAYSSAIVLGILPIAPNVISLNNFSIITGFIVCNIIATLPDKIDNFEIFVHRGFTHSVLGLLTFSIPGYIISSYYHWFLPIAVAFALSYLFHIIADLFTDLGTELFWPYKYKKDKYSKRFIIHRLWYYTEAELKEAKIREYLSVLNIALFIIILNKLYVVSLNKLFQ